MMDGAPFPMVTYPREQIDAIIDIEPYVPAKIAGLMCHATQVDAGETSHEAARFVESPMTRHEFFILGRSVLPEPAGVEKDLFAGLR